MTGLSQRQRTLALFFNIYIALLVHRCVSGRWEVLGETSDGWLVGVCAFWILTLVSSPFFVPPKDTLANAIGALIALLTMAISSASAASLLISSVKWIGVLVCLAAVVLSMGAIVGHSARRESAWARSSYDWAQRVGSGQVTFTPVVLVSAFAGYSDDPAALMSIITLWAIATSFGLTETALQLWVKNESPRSTTFVGRVERFDSPGLIRVLLSGLEKWRRDGVVVVELPNQQQRFALPLFEHPGVEGRLGTAMVLGAVQDHVPNVRTLDVHDIGDVELRRELLRNESALPGEPKLVGLVVGNGGRRGMAWWNDSPHVPSQRDQVRPPPTDSLVLLSLDPTSTQ